MGTGRMRRVHRYSNEFKITAIRLADLPDRDGLVPSDNIEQVLSGSPLRFIPLPLPLAAYSSKHHPGSFRQDPDAAAC
jgi:hypothetical protein